MHIAAFPKNITVWHILRNISPLPCALGDWLHQPCCLLLWSCRASAFLVLLTLPRREVLKKNIQRPSYFDSRANAGKSQCANLVLSTLNKKNTDFSKQNTTKLRAPSKPLEVHGIPFIDSAERWIRQQTRTPHIQRDPYYLAYDCFQFHGPLISYGFP